MPAYQLKQSTIETISHQLRDQGKKVVFTHGSFDLLHAGHSYLLSTSKSKGDTLVVGIESDRRICKYKNPKRPIIPDKSRLEMLHTHRAVDFILYIDGDMPWADSYYLNLYKRLFPSYITYGKTIGYSEKFKKTDCKITGIEYKQIREIALEPNSTTKIIDKIINTYA